MQSGWWVLQDLLGPRGIQASKDLMATLALEAFLASWEQWVRLATRGPRESVERRVIKEKWDVGTPACLGPQGSQVSLAGLARLSTGRMETEGPQGLQEKQADLAYQAQWGFQASVSLQPAWERQRMPLLASQSPGPSKGHEQLARTEPTSVLGPLWEDMYPLPSPGG